MPFFRRRRPLQTLFILLLALPLALPPAPAHAHAVDIVQLAEDNRDTVVSVRGKAARGGQQRQPGAAPFEFFPFPLEPFFAPRQRRRPAPSIGSGFIIDADGHILTNAHVIAGMDEVEVQLPNGDEYPAEVVGADKLTDIALLKISADAPLPTVKIGDSDALKVGQRVVAIGAPFGLEQTVTSGIISALGRRLPRENYVPFIQTDAAINPGNSGGPLISDAGEVVGINSQIISPVRAFAGVSFAIPINDAMEIQRRLRADGTIRRGRLGVSFRAVSKKDAEVFGLDDTQGALIQEVFPESAAAKAGIKSGDILLEVDGKKIAEAGDLPPAVGRIAPGTTIDLTLLREGKIMQVRATLDALDGDSAAAILGMRLENLSDQLRERSGLDGGAVIAAIDYDKAPEDVEQLRRGDVIIGVIIDRRDIAVGDKARLLELLRPAVADKKGVAFRVWRNGRQLVIPVNPE